MTKKRMAKTNVEMQDEEKKISQIVKVQGTKGSLIIVIDEHTPFAQGLAALKREFKKASFFYREAVAHIGYGARILNYSQKKKLRELCKEYEVLYHELQEDYKEQGQEANCLLITRTMRSGQKVEYNGHVVVLGDVQAGAEIAAAGHVIVWGFLRGVVHAGAAGNEKSMVCAMRLVPVQLRIADFVAIDMDIKDSDAQKPEIAFLKQGEIVSEEWDTKSFVKMGVALEDVSQTNKDTKG